MSLPDGLRIPSIDGLRAVEAAARLGSFERAADELAISASAVGKRVATVEDLLGLVLFERHGKALAPTAAGLEYLEPLRVVLSLLASMPQHRSRAQRRRKLRISAPPTFARQILVPELASFTAAHPAIEIEVVLSIPYLDLGNGVADVSVRAGDPQAVEGARVLMDDVVLPMAAPRWVDGRPPLRRPADLAGAALLRTPIEPWVPWFRAAGLDWPEPDDGPRLVDLGLVLEAALGGQGVALVRPSLARTALAGGALRPLFDITTAPIQAYHVPPVAGDDARHFVDWLAGRCAQAAAAGWSLVRTALSGTPG